MEKLPMGRRMRRLAPEKEVVTVLQQAKGAKGRLRDHLDLEEVKI
jgi:hypothetical protein